jgi:hypothetical protein
MRLNTAHTTMYRYASAGVEVMTDEGGTPEAVVTVQAEGMPTFALRMDRSSLEELIEDLKYIHEKLCS